MDTKVRATRAQEKGRLGTGAILLMWAVAAVLVPVMGAVVLEVGALLVLTGVVPVSVLAWPF